MKLKTTWLADSFDWIGDSIEKFGPSAFKFLAAILPYATPIPVAWLTAHSSATFLKFTSGVAFIFVFALEGIGLWFTALLVDAFVDWIRSRNSRTFAIVLLFGAAVSAYIFILVNLNVTLESASGNDNPALSKVITLLCFLPLITGIGNGYYKLKLEYAKKSQEEKAYERSQQEIVRSENRADRMKRYEIKHGANGKSERMVTNEQNVRTVRTRTNKSTNERSGRTNGELRTFVINILDEHLRTNEQIPGVSAIARTIAKTVNEHNNVRNPDGTIPDSGFERYKGYVSEVRSAWIAEHS